MEVDGSTQLELIGTLAPLLMLLTECSPLLLDKGSIGRRALPTEQYLVWLKARLALASYASTFDGACTACNLPDAARQLTEPRPASYTAVTHRLQSFQPQQSQHDHGSHKETRKGVSGRSNPQQKRRPNALVSSCI